MVNTDQRNSDEHPKHGHERRDISIRGIVIFGGILAGSTAIVLLLIAWMFHFFTGLERKSHVPPSPLAVTRRPPPEPRLQVSPSDDLKTMQAAEDAQLNNYAWVNRQTGIVRIPVGRAIELLAERGLPVRSHDKETQ